VGFETRHVSGFWFLGLVSGVRARQPGQGVGGWTEHTTFAARRGSATPPRREMIVVDLDEGWNSARKV
jgi:hypothetical protein